MNTPTVIGYIKDQPRALQEAFKRQDEFVNPFIDVFKANNIKKVFFFGSGTSYNVSVVASYYFKHIVGVDAQPMYPTVFQHYEKPDWTGSLQKDEILFVGISQSGTSISTIDAVKKAKSLGYNTLAITEELTSEITNHVTNSIRLLCGKELLPPETRGYTVSILTVFLLAVGVAKYTGSINEEEYNQFMNDTQSMVDNFQSVIEESEAWYDRNKTTMINSERVLVLGYGVDYGSALEAQLKIGEMFRYPCLGYEIEEYVHGPTMSINPRQTILIFGAEEPEWQRMMKFRDIFKEYTDRVHLITTVDVDKSELDVVFSHKTNKYLAPIMHTVPTQFLAAKGAKEIGIDTAIHPFKHRLGHL